MQGMNSMEQVEDNTSVMADFVPLNEEENTINQKITKIIDEKTAIQCTACEYCTHGCPKNIAINHGKAGECIGCKQCERACPQHLPIITHLKDVAEKFEKNSIIPTRK